MPTSVASELPVLVRDRLLPEAAVLVPAGQLGQAGRTRIGQGAESSGGGSDAVSGECVYVYVCVCGV